jgi:hypothetical protein
MRLARCDAVGLSVSAGGVPKVSPPRAAALGAATVGRNRFIAPLRKANCS